jgi:outer membrane protein assembly factor BamB
VDYDSRTRALERSLGANGGAKQWLRLSVDHARASRFEEAAEYARRAVALAPTNRIVRTWLCKLDLSRGPWPGVFGSGDNNCQSKLRGARRGQLAWRVVIPGLPTGTPIVGPSGQLFVTTMHGELVTISSKGCIEDTEPLWDALITPTFDFSGRLLAICQDRGPLRSNFRCQFLKTRQPIPDRLVGAHVDAYTGRVYSSFNGHFYLSQGMAFRPLAAIATPPHLWARPVPAFDEQGRIYVGSVLPYAGELSCLDCEGRLLWSFHSRSIIAGPVIASLAERSLVARIGDQIYGLTFDGAMLWRRKTHIPDWWRLPSGSALPPAAVFGDIAVIVSSFGVTAVSVDSGKEIFLRADLKTTRAIAVDADGIFHISVPGRMVGINAEGKTVYEVSLPGRGRTAGAPVISFHGMTLAITLDSLIAVS